MDNPLEHEKKLYDLRENAKTICERCEKNNAKRRILFACGQSARTGTPFHDCPHRIEINCLECHCSFEVPIISFLYMTKCTKCYKKGKKHRAGVSNE